MTTQNILQQIENYRLSRRTMLAGLAGMVGLTSAGAVLAACSSETNNPGASPTVAHATKTPQVSPTASSTAVSPIGTTIYEYRGHTLGVFAVAWSPDGKRIASGSFDKTVQVWDALTGQHVFIYRGHTDQVNSISWSPDGKYIASSGDGTVQVWDPLTGHLIFKRGSQVYGTSWSPDSKQLACGNGDSFQVWEVATGKQVSSFGNASMPSCCPIWSPDGSSIAAFGVNTIGRVPVLQLWDITTHTIRFTSDFPNRRRSALVWSPDGQRLAYDDDQGMAKSWKAFTELDIVNYPGGSMWLCLDYSPDGAYLVAGSYDGVLRIWNAQNASVIYTKHVNSDVQAIAWSPNGHFIASPEGSVVRVWQGA